MADLTAEILGSSNQITKSQAVQQAGQKMDERADYLADVLAEGTRSLPGRHTYFSARAGEGPAAPSAHPISSHTRSGAHTGSARRSVNRQQSGLYLIVGCQCLVCF